MSRIRQGIAVMLMVPGLLLVLLGIGIVLVADAIAPGGAAE